MISKKTIKAEEGGREEEVWSLPREEELLRKLFTELFDQYYEQLTFGIFIPGVAYELKAPGKPELVTLSDGYLTVHWGRRGHFHLCIGQRCGGGEEPNAAAMMAHRAPGRVELYRRLDREGLPQSWGLRMFNGRNEQQITVLLPNPYLTQDDKLAAEPDWSRLGLWEELLPRYTGNPPDGRDRLSRGFRPGY
jgi:hypothetical protein